MPPSMPFTHPPRSAELSELFARCDRNDDGQIDADEFGELLAALEFDEPHAAPVARFTRIDHDGDGRITFAEFMSWWDDD